MYDADSDSIRLQSISNAALLSVCIEPTNRCPGRCPYCLIEFHKKDPTVDELVDRLGRLRDMGVMRVGWGGGEPLLRSDIYQLGCEARSLGMGSLLRSSGMFAIDPGLAKEAFDWIDLSIDSHVPEVFARCRPGVNFDQVVTNVENLTANDDRVRISMLVTQMNQQTILGTIEWLARKGVHHIRMQGLVRRGRAKKNWRAVATHDNIRDELINNAIAFGSSLGLDIRRLQSVSVKTLIILKPDGSITLGDPNGQTFVGHVDDSHIKSTLIDLIGLRQTENYTTDARHFTPAD